ncbi:protein CFAP276-like [Hydractinia symbiolongicarpus]|uniref:protein CFAP276-like n=1 Tax=Hydractinia symbiolongicarpus TaxID=13093 RepID=UPI00254A2B26|nr:protein CFAP276-like [Hydractinia symbiolongicarpus]
MSRDPFSFPRFENDNDFSSGKQIQKPMQRERTLSSQRDEPWNRLYETKTLASVRREIFHHDPQTPNDSLDFVIKSVYDHHQEFLQSSAQTLYQPETLGLPHGRVLKNRSDPSSMDNAAGKKIPIVSMSDKKESIHSINGAIPSHHSAATNRGYSRKHDGGFYGC